MFDEDVQVPNNLVVITPKTRLVVLKTVLVAPRNRSSKLSVERSQIGLECLKSE